AKARSRLFASFVEMVQNVIHYAAPDVRPGGPRRRGTIELGSGAAGFWIHCSNPVRGDHATRLQERLEAIRQMSPEDITTEYRRKLNDDSKREPDPLSRGAGLGLLSIARNSAGPLTYSLNASTDGAFTFSLLATVHFPTEAAR